MSHEEGHRLMPEPIEWVQSWTDAYDRHGRRVMHAVVTTRRGSFPCGRAFTDWGLLTTDTAQVREVARLYDGRVCLACWDRVQDVEAGLTPVPALMRARKK